MSGTSLDGLDIACCHFKKKHKQWSYSIKAATTVRYPSSWAQKLSTAHNLPGEELIQLDASYGKFLGKVCGDFVKKHKLKVDFIASHGHTVFHQPKQGFTYQLGNGNALQAVCGIPVVCDFRSLDVMLGGEGAPLVPAGDKILFSEFDICLNLGGIANLSTDIGGKRRAFDICFSNMGLNYLMNSIGKAYDVGGRMAAGGSVHQPMLKELDEVYAVLRPKRPSLGREIFEQRIVPILDLTGISLKDKLRTFTVSAAREIGKAVIAAKNKTNVLCTGGGTYNSFLISQLLEQCGDEATIIIPEDDIIKFKEALVFAFLGVLKVRGEVNCLQSVTGATRDSSSGVLVGF